MDYDRIFPDHKNLSEGDIRKSVAGNVHGQQADCMSCHYKLDPMGQVFGFSAATVSVKPATGALRFEGADGRKVDIPLRGIGDLGTTIVKQPEYEKCQVSHFWNWYIGKDVPLTSTREEALVKAFNDVGRKPKDFIAYLVSLPEFKEKPQLLTEDQLLARRVVKIFKNCNSCHESTGEAVWDLTDLPYHKDPRRREKMVQELREVLDTENDGRNAEMPPEDSLWKLSPDEFDMIKNWINRGAPDFQGVPQVKAGG
ncbi:Cytochrome c [compost metagenome]